MAVQLGNIYSMAYHGVFTENDGSAVFPAVGEVEQGVTYGPTGADYTGTLGAATPQTASDFDTMYATTSRAVLFDFHAITGTYTVKSSGQVKTIQVRWVPRAERIEAEGPDIDLEGTAAADIYDDDVNGVASPAMGDTLTVDSEVWTVKSWDSGPGEIRLELVKKDPLRRGGGYNLA